MSMPMAVLLSVLFDIGCLFLSSSTTLVSNRRKLSLVFFLASVVTVMEWSNQFFEDTHERVKKNDKKES
jgi:hypothetical protein